MDLRRTLDDLGEQTIRFNGSTVKVGDTRLMVLLNYLYPGMWLDALEILDDPEMDIERVECEAKREDFVDSDDIDYGIDADDTGGSIFDDEADLQLENRGTLSKSLARDPRCLFFFALDNQACNPNTWTCSCSEFLISLYDFREPGCSHVVALYLMTETPSAWSKRSYRTTVLNTRDFLTRRLTEAGSSKGIKARAQVKKEERKE